MMAASAFGATLAALASIAEEQARKGQIERRAMALAGVAVALAWLVVAAA